MQDTTKPVFSFPIFEEPLEIEIKINETESPYVFTLPDLINDFYPEDISFVIKKLDKNIALDQEERTLTIDFEKIDED